MSDVRHTLVVCGASSALASAVVCRVRASAEPALLAAGHRPPARPDSDPSAWRDAVWIDVDVEVPQDLERLLDAIEQIPPDHRVTVLYCCGRWHCAPIGQTQPDDIAATVGVGLMAPMHLTAGIAKRLHSRLAGVQVLLVTGLGGERAGVAYNAVYGAVTGGIYNFVRGVAMEWAAASGQCTLYAPGLFDKGQPYVHALCANLVTGHPTPLADVADIIARDILFPNRALNGAVVELGGGLFNYQDAARCMIAGR